MKLCKVDIRQTTTSHIRITWQYSIKLFCTNYHYTRIQTSNIFLYVKICLSGRHTNT